MTCSHCTCGSTAADLVQLEATDPETRCSMMRPQIKIILPAGLDVEIVVERAQVAQAPRYAPAGGSAPAPAPAAPRGGQVTTGRCDGSATEKQRGLLRWKCRDAGVDMMTALGWCSVPGIVDLGWRDLKEILERLEAPAAPATAPDDMEGMPF